MKLYTVPVGYLQTNCYLLSAENGDTAVFDCGDEASKIEEAIERHGLKPRCLIITHGHHDHIGAIAALRARYGVPVRISAGEARCLSAADRAAVVPVKDGDVIELGELRIRAISTPGHTADGMTFVCGDLMFAGDTLFYEDCGRCDLQGGDYGVMQVSLRKLSELPGDYRVLPGHGRASTMEHEREHNPYFEWKKK